MKSSPSIWAIRVLVIGAFILTVWLRGPRAIEVLAARFEGAGGVRSPLVDLDRVGFLERPDWLVPAAGDGGDAQRMLLEVATALSPWLSDEVGILDEASSLELRDGLRSVPWVEDVRIERVFPEAFRLRLVLRRPLLRVHAHDDTPLCLVDGDGVMLPFLDVALPKVCLYQEGGAVTMSVEPGRVAPDARVVAAAAIATEWREQIEPQVEPCPALLEVDATNLDEAWLCGPQYPEVRVLLARGDGAPVVFQYGRPVASERPRIPAATKASVLRQVLDLRPGLEGLVAGELRLRRRWRDYLQPRPEGVPSPYGEWADEPPVERKRGR